MAFSHDSTFLFATGGLEKGKGGGMHDCCCFYFVVFAFFLVNFYLFQGVERFMSGTYGEEGAERGGQMKVLLL